MSLLSFGIENKTYSIRRVFSNVYINTSKAFSTIFGLNLCQLLEYPPPTLWHPGFLG